MANDVDSLALNALEYTTKKSQTENPSLERLYIGSGVTWDPSRETATEYPKSSIYAVNYEIGIVNSHTFTMRWLLGIVLDSWHRLWQLPRGGNSDRCFIRRGDSILKKDRILCCRNQHWQKSADVQLSGRWSMSHAWSQRERPWFIRTKYGSCGCRLNAQVL